MRKDPRCNMEGNNKTLKDTLKLSPETKCIEKLERNLEQYFILLSTWRKKKYKIEQKESYSPEKERIYFLENKILILDLKFKILKNSKIYISQKKTVLFEFIKSNEKRFSIQQMCTVLKVNLRTYRKWKKHSISEKKDRKTLVKEEITSIFFEAKQRYGYNRINIELQNRGFKISRKTVLIYMRELNLQSNYYKKQ